MLDAYSYLKLTAHRKLVDKIPDDWGIKKSKSNLL